MRGNFLHASYWTDAATAGRHGGPCVHEYHGSGHYHKQSFIRDAVKREALRKAGVPTLEVPERFKPADLRADLLGILGKAELARSGT